VSREELLFRVSGLLRSTGAGDAEDLVRALEKATATRTTSEVLIELEYELAEAMNGKIDTDAVIAKLEHDAERYAGQSDDLREEIRGLKNGIDEAARALDRWERSHRNLLSDSVIGGIEEIESDLQGLT